jgi:NADPH:quinone reductase-like Zn-dependent oxidoreductase
VGDERGRGGAGRPDRGLRRDDRRGSARAPDRIFWKQVDVLGSTMGSRADLLALLRRIGAGRLRPVIDSVFPLDEAGAALDRLASGAQFGKVVVEIA